MSTRSTPSSARHGRIRQVTHFYCIAGDADFILIVMAQDIGDYEAFTHRFFFADKNVRKFRSSIVVSTEKATSELPI
uniref:Lrp/AsnC ligand binding domain-containing protein n=1 Tax=Paracoccus liaowanqingii TaxID=2560053 RepID=UPI002F3EFCB8